MYIVEWDNHEGNRHQLEFNDMDDAQLEAASLKERYDFVQVREESEQ